MQKIRSNKLEIGRTISKALLSTCLSIVLLTASQLSGQLVPIGLVLAAENLKTISTNNNQKTKTKSNNTKTIRRDDYSALLLDIMQQLKQADQKIDKKRTVLKEKKALKKQQAELVKLHKKAMEEFSEIGADLKRRKLPQVIVDRHEKAVSDYQNRVSTLQTALNNFNQTTNRKQQLKLVTEALTHLDKHTPKRKPVDFGKDNLPSQSLKPNRKLKPRLKRSEFINAGLYDQSILRVAAHGNFDISKLVGANNPAYLATTPDANITQEIQDLAADLEHNPVKIYQYVYNTVEWVPSFGSIQGAHVTLQNETGGAIDIASLLIALLRASDIPARYVHGTIDMSAGRFMNWLGGFTDTNAAWDFASAAGLPVQGIISGGTVKKFRMEHVWVEAAIDFQPSRGAINKAADSWVALDASFKQHLLIPGFDLTQTVSFDEQAYLSQVQSDNPVAYYQKQLNDYLDVNQPDTLIGEAMGYQFVIPNRSSLLPSSLPYKVVIAAARYAEIPTNLRGNVSVSLTGRYDQSLAAFSLRTIDILDKRLTLSYEPATASDAALVGTGTIFDVAPYLLYVKPVFRADGEIISEGTALPMSEEHTLQTSINLPNITANPLPHLVSAGNYVGIVFNIQGINHNILGSKNARLRTNLLTKTEDQVDRDALIGEHLFRLAQNYFFWNDLYDQANAKMHNVRAMRAPSEGTIAIGQTPQYLFGLVRSTSPNVMEADITLEGINAQSKDGNKTRYSSFLKLRGLVSSYNEHAIFEEILDYDSVSAVRLIQLAHTQGIPVHTFDASTASQVMPLLNLTARDIQEIQNALNRGLEVIVPQSNLTINQWRGIGLIMRDPITASGLYRVSGGLLGGSSTGEEDGWQIVALYNRPFGGFRDKLDVYTRGVLKESAVGYSFLGVMSDEDFDYLIVTGAYGQLDKGYEEVGRCTGFVSKAYQCAGIDLKKLAIDNGFPCSASNLYACPSWTPTLFALANKLNINESVRMTNNPLVGDLVFFDHTYDRKSEPNNSNVKCQIGDNKLTHVGIVISKGLGGNEDTVTFAHAGGSGGKLAVMNILDNTNRDTNTALRKRVSLPNCSDSDEGNYSVRSGALFAGYGTLRENTTSK